MGPNLKLIPDFIIPNLERETYGRHLIWDDKNNGSFKISRIHLNSELWNDDCIAVYKAWSSIKKLWRPDDPKKISKAKHRLITALRRNPVVEMLQTESNYYRFRFTAINLEDNTTPCTEVNFSLENTKMKTADNSALCSSTPSDVSQSIAMFMGLPEKIKNDLESPHGAYSLANELFEEKTFISREHFSEMCPIPVEENARHSDTCCCAILLDSTLLSNESCIWHGGTFLTPP